MPRSKLAVTLDTALVARLDHLLAERHLPNRSRAIETAIKGMLKRFSKTRLARECSKLDPEEERSLAEEA